MTPLLFHLSPLKVCPTHKFSRLAIVIIEDFDIFELYLKIIDPEFFAMFESNKEKNSVQPRILIFKIETNAEENHST